MSDSVRVLMDRALVAIMAAIMFAGDSLEATVIEAAAEQAGEDWSISNPRALEGGSPRMTLEEIVREAVTLLATVDVTLGTVERDE